MLDYTKAFDRIKHKLLLSVPKYIGFSSATVTLLKSYLLIWSQAVVLEGNCSIFFNDENGVPQGSLVGSNIIYYLHLLIPELY